MSKALRKQLSARAELAPLSDEESLALTQDLQPRRLQDSLLPSTPTHPSLLATTGPTVVELPAQQRPPAGAVLLGTVGTKPKRAWRPSPKKLWLTEEGLLRQTLMVGNIGAGRTETLLTLGLNTTNTPEQSPGTPVRERSVFFLNAYGDNSLYFKTLSGLSQQGRAGNLRVINLMTGGRSSPIEGLKLSHSVDLFDGFDETMLGRWLVNMVPAQLLATPGRERLSQVLMPTVARLAVALAHQKQCRITVRLLAQLMSPDGVLEQVNNLKGEDGHLARQWHAHNWGPNAEDKRASFLKDYQGWLTVPFQDLDHVFESPQPEVSLAQLGGVGNGSPHQLYVLVLAPALERKLDQLRMLTRSLLTSLRLSLEQRTETAACDTVAIFDEFEHCFDDRDIVAMAGLQNRGCGVVWAAEQPRATQKKNVLETCAAKPATHVMMSQDFRAQYGGALQAEYLNWQRQQLPNLDLPTEKVFQALAPGQGFVWNAHQVWPMTMDYISPGRLRTSFITHCRTLPFGSYKRSSAGMARLDPERQTQVLKQRLAERSEDGVPSLAWCQETVARMLGFASWHEAHQKLAK